jgi:hypothetical protein
LLRTAGPYIGVKGGSESGTIGAPAAIGNAVIDALWHLGVRDITMPITSETVWRALKEAKSDRGERRSISDAIALQPEPLPGAGFRCTQTDGGIRRAMHGGL